MNGCASSLGLANHPDDLCQERFISDALGPHDKAARAVDCASGYAAAGALLGRKRFACDHGFIDGARSLENDPIDRYLLARPHPEPVSRPHAFEGDVFFDPVLSRDPRGLGREIEEGPERLACLTARTQLQDLPEKNESGDHSRGLEIHGNLSSGRAK